MKPYGLRSGLTDGLPSLQVTKGNRATDAIWDAVEAAIATGMDARAFRIEAAEAWEYTLKQQAKEATRELLK